MASVATARSGLRQHLRHVAPRATLTRTHDAPDFLAAFLTSHGVDAAAFHAFVASLPEGSVVTPFSPGYDASRQEANPLFHKYPLIVVYCQTTLDVMRCVTFATGQRIGLCPRAGGHSTAGFSVLDLRLLIDVSKIGGVLIDPQQMVVSVGAGVRFARLVDELDAFGLHTVTGECYQVGVVGYTLGGGYGYTSPQFGMGCDQLLEVTMVLADGSLVIASPDGNHADLFWACQGGTGNNFGIVTALKLKLYKLPLVWLIGLEWPIDEAAEVMTVWQNERTKSTTDTKLGVQGGLLFNTEPQRHDPRTGEIIVASKPALVIRGIYAGPSTPEGLAAAKESLAPFLKVGHPRPDPPLWQQQVTYKQAMDMTNAGGDAAAPTTIFQLRRSGYVNRALTKADYQKIVDHFKAAPSTYNMIVLEPYGGAINAVDPAATAFVHRGAYFDIFADGLFADPSQQAAELRWLSDLYESSDMKSLWSGRYYQNYTNADYPDYERGYWGDNYPRLQAIKAKYDPRNVFHFEQSIRLPLPRAENASPS